MMIAGVARRLPILGVGLTYCSGIEPLLEEQAGLVDVLEVEPQTLWYHAKGSRNFRVDEGSLQRIAALACPKLIHSIGCPVGGTCPPDRAQLALLAEMARALDVPWMSEHLSFNRAVGPSREGFSTGFLLPPRQTDAGVACAVTSIRAMARAIPVPLAVEPGVNYLRPAADELRDGEFVAEVAEGADCGILLDLHNVWANQVNGRQPASQFLDEIPLDRVWEVHLAGGSEQQGYWLDSHSDAIPTPLVDFARAVIPRLPNLRAIIFEIFPAFLPAMGLDLVRSQLEVLHEIWSNRITRGIEHVAGRPRTPAVQRARGVAAEPTPSEWENALGALAIGRPAAGLLARQLSADPGLALMQDLVGEFRASMIVSALPLTSRLLMLTLTEDAFRALLADYWREAPPELFASAEGEGLGAFLVARELRIPHLHEVVEYERALLSALVGGREAVVRFEHDPLMMLRALGEGRLPGELPVGRYEVELTAGKGLT